MKPLVIFGGTFDPVHIGHLRVALEASEFLDADVRLMPAHTPPHRPAPIATAAQRTAMLELVVAGQKNLSVDARELRRAGPSYTRDTLEELRRELPADQSLVLLLGADAFAGLPTWHRWRELFDLAHIVVMTRPGHNASGADELASAIESRVTQRVEDIRENPPGRVLHLPVTPLEISASTVREILAQGRDPQWLLPDALLGDPATLAVYR